MTSRNRLPAIRSLSVVVPAYNEGKMIAETLLRVAGFLEAAGGGGEIIVVDDGSVDGTREEAERMQETISCLRVLGHRPNRGKGYALSRGVEAARGDYVLFLDADLSADISQVERFTESVQAGCDVVIGSRYIPGADILSRQSLPRRFAGKVFRAIVHGTVVGDFTDLTCGFKLFRAPVARELFRNLSVYGWCCDVELLLLVKMRRYSCAEIPIEWRDRKRKQFISPGDLANAVAGLGDIMVKRLRGRYRSPA